MRIVEEIRLAFNSPESLVSLINDRSEELFVYFNTTGAYLNEDREMWYGLILNHISELRLLDYSKTYVRAFVTYLLDIVCRFGQRSPMVLLMPIIKKHGIAVGNRLEAESMMLYPPVTSPSQLIDRFEGMCMLLQEEYDGNSSEGSALRAALLRHYAYMLENTSQELIESYRSRVEVLAGTYSVLNLIIDDVRDGSHTSGSLQAEIDIALEHNDAPAIAHEYARDLTEDEDSYIDELEASEATFAAIRKISANTVRNMRLSGRGEEIITATGDLEAYMYRYGNMHYAKIASALEAPFPELNQKCDVIDWGCGQSISTMSFIENTGAESINMLVLIEPSAVALSRAVAHCRKLLPDTPIVHINKDFDSLQADDLPRASSGTSVNIFSNVLDMESFSQPHLLEMVRSRLTERNYFICASPAKSVIDNARIESFHDSLRNSHPDSYCLYHNVTNDKYGPYWMCNNQYNGYCRRHGGCNYCKDYSPTLGCANKWTRVLKVFSI